MRRRAPRNVAALLAASSLLLWGCGEDFTEGPGDGGTGGGGSYAPIPSCTPGNTHELNDDFSTGDFDPLWETWGDGVSLTDGQLRFDLPTTGTESDYGAVQSIDSYSLLGCQVLFEMVEAPTDREVPADFVFAIGITNNDNVYIAAYQDDMEFARFEGGLKTDDRDGTFDPARDRWWRIREQDGTVYLDTSPDAVDWTRGNDFAAPSWLDAVYVSFSAGVWDVHDAPGAFAMDNVNRSPR
jgi:hypothetical protein